MIKAMSLIDWLRLVTALTITGILLYYNSQLTTQVAKWLGVNDRLNYQYEIVRWSLILVAVSFLGISLNRKGFIETMLIGGGIITTQLLQKYLFHS